MFTPTVHNNSPVPIGAGIVRRQIARDPQGNVFLTREYLFNSNVHTVVQHVPTSTQPTNQGIAVPLWKLQGKKR